MDAKGYMDHENYAFTKDYIELLTLMIKNVEEMIEW